MIDKETTALAINWDDEIVKGTLVARDGAIVNKAIADRLGGAATPAAKPAKAAVANGAAKTDGNGKRPKGGTS